MTSMDNACVQYSKLTISLAQAADLVTDLWRIGRRIRREDHVPDSIVLAWERAMDRLAELGFWLEEHLDEPYHESMRINVVHHELGEGSLRIVECLAPAIYYKQSDSSHTELIRPADVVIRGQGHGTSNG